jgi:diadenosine tetraphosphate (Ap4A) HIT family hydrolase
LDPGHEGRQIPGLGTLATECRSCAFAQLLAERGAPSTPPYVTEDVDENVVVASGPELDGLVVIPRQHVGGLEELAVADRAHVLAALRRVTQTVRERYPEAAARVVVRTDAPASAGHVCFQVVPHDSASGEI